MEQATTLLTAPETPSAEQAGHPRHRLVGRRAVAGDSVVRVGGHRIGAGHFQVIAGPCAVESWRQLSQTVAALCAAGVRIIRGGAYKPRTSPYDFQGLGEEGLKLLSRARDEYGVRIVTEAMSTRLVEPVAAVADVIQIGSRNCQNYDLLQVVARVGKPVILKRGMATTIDEWLCAAEYLLLNGCRDVILCERGIKTFETGTRNTLDLGGVVLAKQRTHLPVIVDPSHAGGSRGLVVPLSLAALAAGADGLLIEAHHDPDSALCDAAQQLPADTFGEVMGQLRSLASALGRRVGR